MLELYFIFYYIPKMMTRLARERNRSAVLWSLIGITVWIGSELLVAFAVAVFYTFGVVWWGWPEDSLAPNAFAYIAALAAAAVSLYLVTRILKSLPREQVLSAPPPPPQFQEQE